MTALGFALVYSLVYSDTYSLTQRSLGRVRVLCKRSHHPAELFGNVKLHLGVVLQGFADADEAAAIFLNGVDEV